MNEFRCSSALSKEVWKWNFWKKKKNEMKEKNFVTNECLPREESQ